MATSNFQAFFYRLSSATPIKTQAQLANELNVGRSAISLAKQKDTVPSKWILKLAQKYRISSEWLSSGTNPSHPEQLSPSSAGGYFNIPKLDPKLDKNGYIRVDHEKTLDLHLPPKMKESSLDSNELVFLQMQGPAMEPEIKNGDYIIIDQALTEIYAGFIYGIATDYHILIRRIEKGPGTTLLLSENSTMASYQIPDSDLNKIKIIGRIINTIRKYI